jgi:diguanylate cyclase (GGDEF)-like protein
MGYFTNQQLQLVMTQLDQAIYSHNQWYKKLLRVLITHQKPDESDLMLDAHKQCSFGQMYENLQTTFIQENSEFISLGHEHELMHNNARTLLQRTVDGLPISLEELDYFDNSLDKMRFAFQALRDEFSEIVHNRDPLTEAQTRANLLTELSRQQSLVQRGLQSCALIMFDLDYFKKVNDEYGHSMGDAVLVSSIKYVKLILREYDHINRYGGGFIICMPSTTIDQASLVAERIRESIADQQFEFDNLKVTASFGVSLLSDPRTVKESINCSDKAKHKAKSAGRNCIVVES